MNTRAKLNDPLTARTLNSYVKLSPDLTSIKKSQLALTRHVKSSREQFYDCNSSTLSQKSKQNPKQPSFLHSKRETSRNEFAQRTGSMSQHNNSVNYGSVSSNSSMLQTVFPCQESLTRTKSESVNKSRRVVVIINDGSCIMYHGILAERGHKRPPPLKGSTNGCFWAC